MSSWAAGVALCEALVPSAVLGGDELAAILVCVGALQVTFYVLPGGRPFAAIARRTPRLVVAYAAVIAGGWPAYRVARRTGGLTPAAIVAVAGAVVAASLLVGMLFEGWLDSLAGTAAVAGLAALLYAGLQAAAHAATWTRAEPEAWTAYAGPESHRHRRDREELGHIDEVRAGHGRQVVDADEGRQAHVPIARSSGAVEADRPAHRLRQSRYMTQP